MTIGQANSNGDFGSGPAGELAYVATHAALGCAASAAEGTGCAGGAIGAAASAAVTPFVLQGVDPTGVALNPAQTAIVAAMSMLTGSVAAGLAGTNAQAGATWGENEGLNNDANDPKAAVQTANSFETAIENGLQWLAPRAAGATQLLAGGAMTLTGASLTVAGGAACPETLGAGCGVAAGGVALTGVGLDNVSSGWQTLITGQYTPTIGAQVVSQALPVTPLAGEMFYGNAAGLFGTQLNEYANFSLPSTASSSTTLPTPPVGTVQAWSGTITAGTVPEGGMTAYRIWGGDSAQAGSWLSPIPLESSGAAQSLLALPPGNTGEFISTVQIPAGTQIQYGTAASAFGQPGGGIQIQLLQRIPLSSFGPGVPLPK